VSAARRPSAGLGRPERLLPLACLVSAAVLLASELMSTFELVSGSAAGGTSLCDLGAGERHRYAVAVLAAFAIAAVIVAVLGGSRAAAAGVAIAGLGALMIFAIVDLPQANDVGNVSGACDPASRGLDARAVPQAGFWLEAVGAAALTLSGGALAALNSEQLRGLRPRWLGRGPQGPTRGTSNSVEEASVFGRAGGQRVDK
jgi:hypothetical protein